MPSWPTRAGSSRSPARRAYLADGRVLIGGELAHDGYDARCLFADGGLLTPASLYVRRVCGRLGTDLLVEASEGEPSEQHLYRVGTRAVAADGRGAPADRRTRVARRATRAARRSSSARRSLDHHGTRWTVHSGATPVGHPAHAWPPRPRTPRGPPSSG